MLFSHHQRLLWLIQDIIGIHIILVIWMMDLQSSNTIASIKPLFLRQ